MNCKPGDIALWKTAGVLVSVFHTSRPGMKFTSVCGRYTLNLAPPGRPAWRVRVLGSPQIWSTPGTASKGRYLELSVFDASLIPIRDQPGEDETLTWVGKPQEVSQ